MPAVHVCSFGVLGLGARQFWKREAGDDTALAAWQDSASSNYYRNFAVDNSGATPLLTWDVYSYVYPTGYQKSGTDSIELAVGDYIRWAGDASSATPIAAVDVTGCWESDQYGRPFDLNDLLA